MRRGVPYIKRDDIPGDHIFFVNRCGNAAGYVVSSVTLFLDLRVYVSRKNIITRCGIVCGVWRLLWVYYPVWSEGIEVLAISTRSAGLRDVLQHKLFTTTCLRWRHHTTVPGWARTSSSPRLIFFRFRLSLEVSRARALVSSVLAAWAAPSALKWLKSSSRKQSWGRQDTGEKKCVRTPRRIGLELRVAKNTRLSWARKPVPPGMENQRRAATGETISGIAPIPCGGSNRENFVAVQATQMARAPTKQKLNPSPNHNNNKTY